MAALIRAVRAQGRFLVRFTPKRCPQKFSAAFISTSKKNKDMSLTTDTPSVPKSEYQRKLEEHFADADPNAEKNWISTGFDRFDRQADTNQYNGIMFFTVTLVFCLGGFLLTYMPGDGGIAWAQREAHLELERREKAGLPPIDVDYLPADKINLPPDSELKDVKIIT